jgi:adenylate cyclase
LKRPSIKLASDAAAIAIPALLSILLVLSNGKAVESLRDIVFDTYQRLGPRSYDPAIPVRVAAIDNESLARIGQWPWPRDRLARLVDALHELGAAAVVFDVLFAERDRVSAEEVLKQLPDLPEKRALEAAMTQRAPSHDASFATAIAAQPTVLGLALGDDVPEGAPQLKSSFAMAGDDARLFVPRFLGAIAPMAELAEPAKGLASMNWIPDRDLVIRRVPLLFVVGEQLVPSLALEALRVAQQASTIIVKSSNASGEEAYGRKTGVNAVKVGAVEVKTDADGAIRIHYAGTKPQRRVPVWQVLAGEAPRELIEGHIVLIGTSALSLSDIRATPLEGAVPGVDVHAEILEQMLDGTRLTRPDYAKGLEILAVVLGSLAAFGLARALRPATAAICLLLLLGGVLAISWWAFSAQELLFDPLLPLAATVLTYVSTTVIVYRRSEAERRAIRDAFTHYVSPDVVNTLVADPSKLKLGGETREVTIMFADVRGFTSRSESLKAEEVIRFLNAIHTPLTQAVLDHKGTIDKYMGDGLMAFWNAPLDDADHVRHACRAALVMSRMIPRIDEKLSRDLGSSFGGVPLGLGIGLNTGSAAVGNMGSDLRFDYSIVGDSVNVAARLEPMSKPYGVPIVCAQELVVAAADFAFVPLGALQLKGKSRATRLYALHGDESAVTPAFKRFLAAHAKALAATEAGDPDAAAQISALQAFPEARTYAATYEVWLQQASARPVVSPAPQFPADASAL